MNEEQELTECQKEFVLASRLQKSGKPLTQMEAYALYQILWDCQCRFMTVGHPDYCQEFVEVLLQREGPEPASIKKARLAYMASLRKGN